MHEASASASPAAAPVLDISNLSVSYGAVSALRGVNLLVQPGEVVALLGANGAGKSTTLRTISGLGRPRTGEIRFLGERIDGLPSSRIVRLGVAHSPEGRRLFGSLTVAENLRLGAAARAERGGIDEDRERIYALFPRLREREKNLGGNLSGGEQQMLAIGRALMTNPKLLILDEATEGLAPLIRGEIWQCLKALKGSGLSILCIDKNLAPMLELGDHHYIVDKGRVAWHGDSAGLRRDMAQLHAYLGV